VVVRTGGLLLVAAGVLAACSSSSAEGPADASTEASADGLAQDGGDDSSPSDAEAGPILPGDGADGLGGHVLIADQFNNRVIEIDRQGNIVWQFGDGASQPGPTSIVAPNDAERLSNGNTLIVGTGAPAQAAAAYGVTETACAANGCRDNRVILVDSTGTINWQYGASDGTAGAGPNQLSTPVAARMLSNGNVLITDQGNARIIEVATNNNAIVWQYPPSLDGGSALSNPNSAERLSNGNTLIADQNNNRVIEVTTAGDVVWQYPQKPSAQVLSLVAFASRLPNGNTLVVDSANSRVVEVTPQLAIVWSFVTNKRAGSFPQPFPTHAMRLMDGDTLIADQLNDQVIEVNQSGAIVFAYGLTQLAGAASGELSAPYDAKVIADYTGLSAPQ
jgi:outer membrane protein assembly factor BamB